MKEKIYSQHGLVLIDQWDEGEFEKDIQTVLLVDQDTSEDKPIYIELKDLKGDNVVNSVCIALSGDQGLQLVHALLKMIPIKWNKEG